MPLLTSDIRLDSIEAALINVTVKREFSFGVWNSRQHLFLKITSGDQIGWGEEIISLNTPDVSLDEWGGLLQELETKTLGQAIAHMKQQDWPYRLREAAEMALIDLYGKKHGISACDILELSGTEAVPGLFCILEQDPDALYEKALEANQFGTCTHLKIKLFGKVDLDEALITAAKKAVPEVFLVGDVNMGYRTEYQAGDITDVLINMRRLQKAGLDACEDPAQMDQQQWIKLQQDMRPLQLIPDEPLRPASEALQTVVPNLGDMFNIHPGAMGSLLDAADLIRKVQSFSGSIMIGDNSLIGPACTVWQQIAVGAGAVFVEALEKEAEFPAYLDMIRSSNTTVRTDVDGKVHLTGSADGFGLSLDEEMLKKHSEKWVRIF